MRHVFLVTVGLVALASVSAAIAQPWEAAGQGDERSIYVDISEIRFGWNENLPDGGNCSFVGQQFGLLSSVDLHLVVQNQNHRIIAVQQVGGTIQHAEGDEFYRCAATFDMPLPEADFDTILLNDVYYATIAEDRLPGSSVIIVRESGENWRPAA